MRLKVMPHVKRVTSKGHAYYYFITGQVNAAGKPILARLPDIKDPTFGTRYATMLSNKTKRGNAKAEPHELTVTKLAALYEKSPKFTGLSDGSKRVYRTYLDQLTAEYPTAPAGKVERRDIVLILDKRADRPAAANLLLAVTAAMYAWGRERGHVTNDPCADIAQLEVGEWEPWPDHILKAALKCNDGRVRLATHLLFYTAQRIGDVVAMRWTDVRDGALHVTQQKTGKTLEIRMHRALAAELARHPRSLSTILAKEDGSPWSQKTIRPALQAFAAGLGASVVPHGLRKNAVNALLEAGCSVAETAAISGQSLGLVEHYAKRRAQGVLGSSAVLKWEAKKS